MGLAMCGMRGSPHPKTKACQTSRRLCAFFYLPESHVNQPGLKRLQDRPHGGELTSVGFRCLPSLPLEWVAYGGCWLLIYSLGVLSPRPPGRCRPRSAASCALARATQHELQNNLQMAATCAGLEGIWKRPSYMNQDWLLLVPDLGPLSEGYGACRGQMLFV